MQAVTQSMTHKFVVAHISNWVLEGLHQVIITILTSLNTDLTLGVVTDRQLTA